MLCRWFLWNSTNMMALGRNYGSPGDLQLSALMLTDSERWRSSFIPEQTHWFSRPALTANQIPERSGDLASPEDSCDLFHPVWGRCGNRTCVNVCLNSSVYVCVCVCAAPVIVTPPGEVYNVSGSQVYLSCEAVGVPTPVLTWKKVRFSVMTHQFLHINSSASFFWTSFDKVVTLWAAATTPPPASCFLFPVSSCRAETMEFILYLNCLRKSEINTKLDTNPPIWGRQLLWDPNKQHIS